VRPRDRRCHNVPVDARGPFDLALTPVHLGLGASISPQENFTGDLEWYERYAERTKDDGADGRLVQIFDFAESWTSWEMHPHGEELVVCVSGSFTLIQERDGQTPGCKHCAVRSKNELLPSSNRRV